MVNFGTFFLVKNIPSSYELRRKNGDINFDEGFRLDVKVLEVLNDKTIDLYEFQYNKTTKVSNFYVFIYPISLFDLMMKNDQDNHVKYLSVKKSKTIGHNEERQNRQTCEVITSKEIYKNNEHGNEKQP